MFVKENTICLMLDQEIFDIFSRAAAIENKDLVMFALGSMIKRAGELDENLARELNDYADASVPTVPYRDIMEIANEDE